MECDYVKCVKIVHEPAEVRVYRILSAFFRLVGIFSCENLSDDEYGDETDIVFRIEKGSEEDGKEPENKASDELPKMKEHLGEEAYDVINQIWNVFKDNDLMRGSYAVDYFADCDKKYIFQQMEAARNRFEKALEELSAIERERTEDAQGNIYLWMAKANCQRRNNEIAKILWNAIQDGKYVEESKRTEQLKKLSEKYIKYDDIEKNIQNVLDTDINFYAAYALRGFVKELFKKHKVDSVDDLKQANSVIGDKSYTSYLWFRIGRYYEKIRPDRIDKMEYYKKAAEADPHNFRAIYKMAMFEQDNRNFDKALELWKHLLEVLESKQKEVSLQPVECAYLYKAYRKSGEIYSRVGNYALGIEYLQKAEAVYRSTANEDEEKGFYPWMFGNEDVATDKGRKKSWEIYKEAAREKLEIKKVYGEIVDASSRGGDIETHKKYRKLYYSNNNQVA